MDEKIAVFGSGSAKQGEPLWQLAYDCGHCLAQAGFTVVNGGYGGTMLASACGAAEAGGKVIGVTCSKWKSRPNQYITEEILTNNLDERLETLINTAGAYIVLPGATGTLLELAKVWEFKNKGFLNRQKKIIILANFWKPLVEMMKSQDCNSDDCLSQAGTPEDALRILKDEFI